MSARLRAAIGVAAILLLAAGAGRQVDHKPLDERTIYIPYKELERVFEKEGRGVFLPYPQFLELWEKARSAGMESTPPVEAVTTAGRYEGSIRGDVAEFKATFSFEVLKEGWTEVPLALGGLALSEAKATGEGAILRASDGGHRLVVPGRGRYGLEVHFGLKVEEKAGHRSISFHTPRAAVSKLKVILPGKDLDVTLDPNLAATINEDADTEVLAFLGASDHIRITWRPRARLMAPGEALISADALERVTIDEGVVQATTTYSLNVLRTSVPGFAIEFPSGYKVTALEGAEIRKWSVREEGNHRVAEVTLNRRVEGEYSLTLSIERVLPGFPGDGTTFEVPRVLLKGARRERGVLAVSIAPDLRAKVSARTGATQIDVADLGEDAKGAALAFRYPQHPYTVEMEVEKVELRVRADDLTIVSIGEERIDLQAVYRLAIQRGGLFRVRLLLPDGYEVVDASSPSGLRDHRVVTSPEGPVLEADLPQKVTGAVEVRIHLERRREGAEGVVSLPSTRALDVVQETGRVGVSLLESLKAVTENVEGLVPQDVREIARGGIGWPSDQILTLGFSYQKHPISADLRISRRESKVTAEVHTVLDAEEDLVKVRSIIRFDVQYAGVDRFRFTLPKEIGEGAHIQGADIKEKRKEEIEGEEEETKRVAWEVSLQRKVLGTYALTVEYDLEIEEAEAEESVPVEIPELVVLDVFTEEGYIAARKEPEVLLNAVEVESLTPVDPRELPAAMGAEGAFLAFQYLRHPVRLVVRVTRHEYIEPLPTLVSHLHTESVLTEEGAIRSETSIALVSIQRQFLRVRLPAAAEVISLSVDGKQKEWSGSDEAGVIKIDLAEGGKQGQEILIGIRYDLPPTSPGGLGAIARHVVEVPVIDGEPTDKIPPPVARVSLNIHVPEDRAYLAFSTGMRRVGAPLTFWERLKRSLFGDVSGDAGGHLVIGAGQDMAGRAAGGGEASVAGALVKSGKTVHFYKLEGGGRVAITHLARPLHWAIDMAVLLALLAAGVILPRREIISAHLSVFGLGGIAIVLLAIAPQPLHPYLQTSLLAAIILALFWVGRFAILESRRSRGGDSPLPSSAPPPPPAPPAGEGPGAKEEPPPAEAKRKRRSSRRSGRARKTEEGE